LVKVCYRNAHCEYCGQKFLGLIDKCPTCSIIIKTASTFFKPFIILVLFKNAVELFEDITKPHTQRGPDVAISCDDTADRAGGLGLKIQFITTQRTPDYPSIPVAAAISTTMNTDVVATTLIYAFSAMFECGRRFMPIRIVSDSALEQHLGKHIASSVCRICMTPAVCVHHKNINQQQRVNDALKSILPVTTLEKTLAGSATITHAGLSATFRSFTLLGSPLHQIIGRAAILFHLTAFAKDKNLSLSSDSLAIFRQELSTIVNALRGKEPGQKLLNRTSPVFYTSTHHPNIDIAISNIFTSPSQRDITLKDSSLTRSLGSKIETRFRDTVQEARSVGERNKKAQDAHTASISTTIPLLTKPHELLALTKDPEVRFLASIFLEALAAVHSEVIKDTDGPGQQMPQLDQPPFGPQVPPFQPQMGPSRKGKVKVLQQLPVEEPIDETLLSIPLLERPLTRQQMQSYFFSSLNLPSTLNDAVLLTAFRTGRIGICNLPGLYTLVMCFNRKANKDAAAAVFPNASTPQSFLKTNFYSSLVSCLYAQGLVDAAATDIVTEPLKISPSIDFEHIYKYYGTPTATTTTTTTIASAFSSSDTPKDQNAQRVYSNQEMADIFLAAWFTDVTSSLCSVTEEATPSLISVLNQGGPQHLLFLDETKIGNILRKDLTSNPSEQLNRLFKRNIDDDTWHGKSGQLANISFRPLPPQPYQQSGPRNLQGLATQSIVAQNAAAADSRWIVEHDLTFHNPNRLNSFIDAQINGPSLINVIWLQCAPHTVLYGPHH
jgi:murein DD-endopeptidase MepM/ murein hydrolase activator NlpD